MNRPTQTIEVKRVIDEKEANEYFKKASQLRDQADEALENAKSYTNQKKAEAAKYNTQANDLTQKARNGYVYEPKSVFVRHDFAQRLKLFIDPKSGDIVDSFPLEAKEYKDAQKTIEEVDQEEKIIEKTGDSSVDFFREKFYDYWIPENLVSGEVAPEEVPIFRKKQLDWIDDNRIKLVSQLIAKMYDAEQLEVGTDFDTAYDALQPSYDKFRDLLAEYFATPTDQPGDKTEAETDADISNFETDSIANPETETSTPDRLTKRRRKDLANLFSELWPISTHTVITYDEALTAIRNRRRSGIDDAVEVLQDLGKLQYVMVDADGTVHLNPNAKPSEDQ